MKSSVLLSLAAILFLGLGLYLILPRGNDEAGPLPEQVEVAGVMDETEVATEEVAIDDAMITTLRQFLDAILALEPNADQDTLALAQSYLSPSLQEATLTDGLTRDDFVTLFDQETRAFPPTSYEIGATEVINENVQEANVRVSYPGEEDAIYNLELERIDNAWKVIAVNAGQ